MAKNELICPNCKAKTEIIVNNPAENTSISFGKTTYDGEYMDVRDKKIEILNTRIEKLTELLSRKRGRPKKETNNNGKAKARTSAQEPGSGAGVEKDDDPFL